MRAARGWLGISFLFCVVSTIVVTITWVFAKKFLDAMGFDRELTLKAQVYTFFALPALWLEIIPLAVSTYLSSAQIMLAPTALSLAAAGVDIAVCWVLVFGCGSYGGMENKLAAVALGWSISAGFGAVGHTCLLAFYSGKELDFAATEGECESGEENTEPLLECKSSVNVDQVTASLDETANWKALCAWVASKRKWGVFLGQALPALGTNMAANIQFTIIGLIAASMGDTVISTHNTLICLFELVHTIAVGMSEATSIRVGFHLGRGDVPAAKCAF